MSLYTLTSKRNFKRNIQDIHVVFDIVLYCSYQIKFLICPISSWEGKFQKCLRENWYKIMRMKVRLHCYYLNCHIEYIFKDITFSIWFSHFTHQTQYLIFPYFIYLIGSRKGGISQQYNEFQKDKFQWIYSSTVYVLVYFTHTEDQAFDVSLQILKCYI